MELDSVATNTTPTESRTRSPLRAAIGYVLMVVVSVGAFLLIRRQGETLLAPVAGNAGPSLVTAPTPDIFLHVLVALTAIIITGQVLARLFARLGQPAVIGEVVAGILLGPS
ncbi:MAG: cation:proton antiporter, partial [Anaerolineae bacterium]